MHEVKKEFKLILCIKQLHHCCLSSDYHLIYGYFIQKFHSNAISLQQRFSSLNHDTKQRHPEQREKDSFCSL